jgi:hypothetical protein
MEAKSWGDLYKFKAFGVCWEGGREEEEEEEDRSSVLLEQLNVAAA